MCIFCELLHHAFAEVKDVGSFLGRVTGALALGALLTVFVYAAYHWFGAAGVAGSFALIYLLMRGIERWHFDETRLARKAAEQAEAAGRVITIPQRKQGG